MPLTTSLVEAWNLQEASGNRAGAFASLTLTDNNTVTQTTGPSSVIPQAALFTAANSEYLSRADEAALSLTGDWTITGWAKLASKPGNIMYACAKWDGVNDGAATTTSFVADGFTEATNDHFNDRLITFISGALNGQQTAITDYVGSSQTFTVTALTEAPADDVFFVIH